ncbi:MAG: c-type cytochrome, partial [Dehalococcoidia bacterium]
MRELALYYANLRPPPGPALGPEAAQRVARGRTIAMEGLPSQRVPACAACHGPGSTRRYPAYPSLAGQHADYLALQLELFGKERRGGTKFSHLMRFVAGPLNAQQRQDVALYYSSLVGDAQAGDNK